MMALTMFTNAESLVESISIYYTNLMGFRTAVLKNKDCYLSPIDRAVCFGLFETAIINTYSK
jgi:hypothetical protein